MQTIITIGRDAQNTLVLPNEWEFASRFHSKIFVNGSSLTYTDISTNGTIINGTPVKQSSIKLHRGDSIVISGRYTLDWNKINPLLPHTEQPKTISSPTPTSAPSLAPPPMQQCTAQQKGFFSSMGRSGRGEYFGICFGLGLVNGFLAAILSASNNEIIAIVYLLYYVIMIWLSVAVGARRCHDLGHSGWFQLIPFYGLAMLFCPGDKTDNEYGKARY